jgi:hypothetical protein
MVAFVKEGQEMEYHVGCVMCKVDIYYYGRVAVLPAMRSSYGGSVSYAQDLPSFRSSVCRLITEADCTSVQSCRTRQSHDGLHVHVCN